MNDKRRRSQCSSKIMSKKYLASNFALAGIPGQPSAMFNFYNTFLQNTTRQLLLRVEIEIVFITICLK